MSKAAVVLEPEIKTPVPVIVPGDYEVAFPISKVERKGDILWVEAVGTAEAKDDAGEIMDLASVVACLPEYLKWGSLWEMHNPKVAGSVMSAKLADVQLPEGTTAPGLLIRLKVVDINAQRLVEEGSYKGVSIRGMAAKSGDRLFMRRIREWSLVDVPMLKLCLFTEVGRAGHKLAELDETGKLIGNESTAKGVTMADKVREVEAVEVLKASWAVRCSLEALDVLGYMARLCDEARKAGSKTVPAADKVARCNKLVAELLTESVAGHIAECSPAEGESLKITDSKVTDAKSGEVRTVTNEEAKKALEDMSAVVGKLGESVAKLDGGSAPAPAPAPAPAAAPGASVDVSDMIGKLAGTVTVLATKVDELAARTVAPKGHTGAGPVEPAKLTTKAEDTGGNEEETAKADLAKAEQAGDTDGMIKVIRSGRIPGTGKLLVPAAVRS